MYYHYGTVCNGKREKKNENWNEKKNNHFSEAKINWFDANVCFYCTKDNIKMYKKLYIFQSLKQPLNYRILEQTFKLREMASSMKQHIFYEPSSPKILQAAFNTLCEDFGQAFNDDLFTDITIVANNKEEIGANKIMLTGKFVSEFAFVLSV